MARTKPSNPTATKPDDLLGRIVRRAKRTAAVSPAAQLEVVLACVDEWYASCAAGRAGFSDMIASLLDGFDWSTVTVDAIRQALRTVLTNAPEAQLAEVGAKAASERLMLKDPAAMLEQLASTAPEAHEALVGLICIAEQHARPAGASGRRTEVV